MTTLLRVSEAASLAIHTMFLLSLNQDKLISTKEIAQTLLVSENHLAKVLQRLVKNGYIQSIRGPKGGFKLNLSDDSITMLDIYESIDGSILDCNCLLDVQICGGNCLLEGFISEVNDKFRKTLASKKLSDLSNKFKK